MSTPRISRLPSPALPELDDGLDDRHGDAHRGRRLHGLEHFFGKPGLAGRHLQFRLAGNPIDRAVEREEDALVGRVHADEHRDAEHDPGDREQRPQHVPPDVRPADEAQQVHGRRTLGRGGRPHVFDDAAVAERNRAIGAARDLEVVGDDHHGGAEPRVEIADQREDVVASLGVEVAGRLVGQQDGRIDRQRARDGDPLALAARQLVGQVIQPMVELYQGQELGGARADLRARPAPQVERQADVLD